MKTFKTLLKSLISNNSAIDGGRKKGKWWVAIILGFVSIILAVIPTLVNNIKVKGSQYLSTNNFGVDFAIDRFVADAKENNFHMIIKEADENHKTNYLEASDYTFNYKHNGNTRTDTIIAVVSDLDVDKYTAIASEEHSYIIFTDDVVMFAVSNLTTHEQQVAEKSFSRAYKDFAAGTDLIEFIGSEYPTNWNNFLKAMDNFANYQRVVGAWATTGIMAAVDLSVILLMGFMVWILTRGKTNPFRMYTVLDGFKIAAWCSLSPAILTIPFAFLISNLPDIWFPLMLGIRVMWLTMKSLRPDGTGYIEEKEVKTTTVK